MLNGNALVESATSSSHNTHHRLRISHAVPHTGALGSMKTATCYSARIISKISKTLALSFRSASGAKARAARRHLSYLYSPTGSSHGSWDAALRLSLPAQTAALDTCLESGEMETDRGRRLLRHPTGASSSCSSSSSSTPPSEEASSSSCSSSSSSSKTSSSSSGYTTSSSDGSCCTPAPSPFRGGTCDTTAAKGGRGSGKAASPPFSSYRFSPFSPVQIWAFRATVLLSFLYGGLVGWPMASAAALLPQLLLRLFTLGGCGLLLVYDVLFGLRWTYTRLLQRQQNQWVQQQLELLLQENKEATVEALMRERLRLRALVAAFRRCLSLAVTASPLAAACAEALAAEADAAAHVALEGDLQRAAALYGVSPSSVDAALQAAKLQQASVGHKEQRRGVAAAAAAAAAAATGSAWAAAKGVLRVACCVPLLMVFVDMPAGAAAAAAAAAGWEKHLHPWLLPLLHAVAQGCLAAAALNLHVGEYTELAVESSAACVPPSKRSPSSSSISSGGVCKRGSGCVLDLPPRRWSVGTRLFVAFALPLFVSLFAAAGSTAAAGGAGWGLEDMLHLPLGFLQLAVELLPSEVSSLLPLQQQRSAAADRLLLLLQQQQALGWLRWPTAEASDMLLLASLVTAVAAAVSRCSSPPPLWKEHAQLEHAAAAAAARKLLNDRELLLQKQAFCSRISSRCSWMGRRLGQWMSGLHLHVGRLMRIGCVFVVGLLWVLLLLTAVSDLPLLRTAEGELQTPLQALEQQLRGEEVQQVWAELLQLKREFTRRSEQEGYEEAFDWLLQLLQESWAQQLEAERSESDARTEALALFDLPETATASEIRHRYRQLARQHHPDLAGTASGAQGHEGASFACGEAGDPFVSDRCKESHQFMQKINLAYEVLLGQAGGKAAGLRAAVHCGFSDFKCFGS
ncbi:hypothetical protein Esti_004643 [Eimeria stiedai]